MEFHAESAGISTHAPHARCDIEIAVRRIDVIISTHAPHARCDRECNREHPFGNHFNSRTSCEVRRHIAVNVIARYPISTHAPHARCDPQLSAAYTASSYFNSRTSCEVRRRAVGRGRHLGYFNSRTSCEVRPDVSCRNLAKNAFQLTHLMRGATAKYCVCNRTRYYIRWTHINITLHIQ